MCLMLKIYFQNFRRCNPKVFLDVWYLHSWLASKLYETKFSSFPIRISAFWKVSKFFTSEVKWVSCLLFELSSVSLFSPDGKFGYSWKQVRRKQRRTRNWLIIEQLWKTFPPSCAEPIKKFVENKNKFLV